MNIHLLNIHRMEESDKAKPYNAVIMRGTPLGNPYKMIGRDSRDEVCNQYEVWFERQLLLKNPAVVKEMKRLLDLHAKWGQVGLVCCCVPRRCHGETIVRHLKRLEKSWLFD
jgi:hypothetical protein